MGLLNIFRDKSPEPSDRFSGSLSGPKTAAELAQSFRRANWLVDNNGVVYGKNTDTGNFHVYENGKLKSRPAYLAAGETVHEMSTREYKSRVSVQADTHKTLSQYRTEMSKKFNEKDQAGRAANALDREAQFVYLNGELVNAWKKDVRGAIIEGGLIGWANSFGRTSHISKAIEKIRTGDASRGISGDAEMAERLKNSINMMITEHRAEIQALTRSKRDASVAAQILGPIVGVSPDVVVDRIKTDPNYTRRAESSIGTLLSIAISSALGSPDVLLGMVRIPVKGRRSSNPSKEIVSYALFGKTYSEIAGTADRESRKYISGINKQSSAPDGAGLDRFKGALGKDIYAHEIYGAMEIKGSERWYEFIDKRRMDKLKDPNVPVRDKLNYINSMVAEKESELGISKLSGPDRDARIEELKQNPRNFDKLAALDAATRLRTLYNMKYQVRSVETRKEIGDAVKLQKIFNGYNTLEEFEQAYDIPSDPDSIRGIKVWFNGGKINGVSYEARDPEISRYLWNSRETLGIQHMAKHGFTGRKLDYHGYKRRNKEYGPDITNTVNSKESLSDYVDTQIVAGNYLADVYASQIYTMLGVNVSPKYLVSQMRTHATIDHMEGVNSGFDTKIPNKIYNGLAWQFPIEATLPNGERGYVYLGIKPNCSNLIIAKDTFTQRPIVSGVNPSSWQNIRLAITAGMFRRVGEKTKGKDKPDRPDTPDNPDTPKKPGEPQGYSEPQTTVVDNPPVSATETPVPAGYTEVRTATLPSAPTSTSAGGAPATTVPPPPPAPPLPPAQG